MEPEPDMHAAHLYNLEPQAEINRRTLAGLRGGLRAMDSTAGLVRLQTFRSLGATDRYWVLVETSSDPALQAADQLLREARADNPEPMEKRFSSSSPTPSGASLLRVVTAGGAPPALEKNRILQTLGAPGAVAAQAFTAPDMKRTVWQVDFESEEALWAYMDSPLCHSWSGSRRQTVDWALDLPEWSLIAGPEPTPGRSRSGLDLDLDDDQAGGLTLTLEGRASPEVADRIRFVLLPIRLAGCRRLTLDLTRLEDLSPEVLTPLLEAAHIVREAGGEVELIDQRKRTSRAVRQAHLLASLNIRGGPQPVG